MNCSIPLSFSDNGELFAAVLKICRIVRENGGRALLAGGCVRDALLGTANHDFDVECYGLSPERIAAAVSRDFALDPVGMSFGVFKVRHLEIDLALPRRENKIGAGHRGFMVDCEPDLGYAEACSRRDFTVNAMLYDPLCPELIDPWNGRNDLADGILRHVSEHFTEDPLRVLRAMQFAARFGFRVAPETVGLCRTVRQDELPIERLSPEWEKLLLLGTQPSLGLEFLRHCGWERYYPELAARGDSDRTRMLCAIDATVPLRSNDDDDNLVLALAVLCRGFSRTETERFIARIWRRTDLASRVIPLVAHGSAPCSGADPEIPDGTLRRLAVEVGRLDLLARAAECVDGNSASLRKFRERAAALGILHAPPTPILQGRDLIARGIAPGPDMGKKLKQSFEAQLDGAFADLPGALRWLECPADCAKNSVSERTIEK